MKFSKLIFLLGLGFICTITSCRKPIEPEPTKPATANLDKAESEALLNNTSVQMKTDVKDMRNCDGVKKLEAMQNLPGKTGKLPISTVARTDFQSTVSTTNSIGVVKIFKEIMFSAPVAKVNARENNDEDTIFDFKSNLGTYTWNNAQEEWVETKNLNGAIEFNFPTDTTKMNVNDGKLIISNYAEIIIDGTAAPTSMIAEFTVAGSKFASINFAASYKDKYPAMFNLKAYLKPWNFEGIGKDNGGSASASYSVFKDKESAILSANVTLTFTNGDKEKPLLGTGYYQYRDLKIGGKVMAKEIMDADSSDVSELQTNTWIDLDVMRSSDNAKLADVYLQLDNDEAPVLIKLNDGTAKLPEDYFKDVIDELKSFEKDFKNDNNL